MKTPAQITIPHRLSSLAITETMDPAAPDRVARWRAESSPDAPLPWERCEALPAAAVREQAAGLIAKGWRITHQTPPHNPLFSAIPGPYTLELRPPAPAIRCHRFAGPVPATSTKPAPGAVAIVVPGYPGLPIALAVRDAANGLFYVIEAESGLKIGGNGRRTRSDAMAAYWDRLEEMRLCQRGAGRLSYVADTFREALQHWRVSRSPQAVEVAP